MSALRTAVRSLLADLAFRQTEAEQGRPCRLMRTSVLCGLVVPAMYGADDYLRAVQRRTVDELVDLGFVVLGDLDEMPRYNYGGDRWGWGRCGLKGRTIALTAAGLEAAR